MGWTCTLPTDELLKKNIGDVCMCQGHALQSFRIRRLITIRSDIEITLHPTHIIASSQAGNNALPNEPNNRSFMFLC